MDSELKKSMVALDNELSKRYIALDPGGYFIIYVDREAGKVCAKHYTNTINEKGLAVDPETGKVIPTKGKVERSVNVFYSARTAKELCIKVIEEPKPPLITMLDHAAYLGREFLRAEIALIEGTEYIQD